VLRLGVLLAATVGFVVVVVVSFVGNRPSLEQFFSVNGLAAAPETSTLIRARLRATYRGRVAGALIGALLGAIAGSVVGWVSAFGGGVIGVLAGAMAGMAVAQASRLPSAGDRRFASLDVRDPVSYAPRRARLWEGVLAVMIAAYGFVVVMTFDEHAAGAVIQIGVGVAAIVAVAGGRWIRRGIVEHRRARLEPAAVSADDALRAVGVRGIHHATMGVLFCGLLLLGVAAVRTQTFDGVAVDGRVVVRVAPGSHDLVVMTLADGAQVRWTDQRGTRHLSRAVVPTAARHTYHTYTVGRLWDHGWLVALGYVTAMVGFVGALAQLRRASRAWRYGQVAVGSVNVAAP
jgi:hypothetical protein